MSVADGIRTTASFFLPRRDFEEMVHIAAANTFHLVPSSSLKLTFQRNSVKILVLLSFLLVECGRSRDDDTLLDAGSVLALEERGPQVRLDDFL